MTIIPNRCLALAALTALAGCTTTAPAGDSRLSAVAPPPVPAPVVVGADAGPPTVPDALTLADAVRLALAHNPTLDAAAWNYEAGAARVLQAGRLPNPQLGFTVEDVAGTGNRAGGQEAETTLRLLQLFELGGKRSARQDEASRGAELTAWDYEAARLDLRAATTRAFLDVLAAQERLALAGQSIALAESMVAGIARLVDAGRESSAEATRAEVTLATVEIDRAQTQRDLDTARQRLAALWGAPPRFSRAAGRLDEGEPVPPLAALESRLAQNPDLARWDAEFAQRQAAVALAEANAIPNLTLEGGLRRYEDTDDTGFVFGAVIPLPLLDRNQGAIAEARTQLSRAYAQRSATATIARTELAATYGRLTTARAEASALRQRVLPAATRAFEIMQAGYDEGRYRSLDVLDAQRMLIAARERLLRAVIDGRQAETAIERIIGGPLEPPTDASSAGVPTP